MKVFIVSCMFLSVALAQAVPSSQPSAFLQECFEKDSISCVQSTVLFSCCFFVVVLVFFLHSHLISEYILFVDLFWSPIFII